MDKKAILLVMLLSFMAKMLAIPAIKKSTLNQREMSANDSEIQQIPIGFNTSDYRIVNVFIRPPPYYYTEGLTFADNNTLLESAGLYGESAIHFIRLNDSTTFDQTGLDAKFFGEGTDFVDSINGERNVYQLTWLERTVFVYDGQNLTLKGFLNIPQPIKEGWGLAKRYDNENGTLVQNLYISDGTSIIYVCEPTTLSIKRQIRVLDSSGNDVNKLNELEFVNDKLWANIYLTNKIAIIDTETGNVDRFIDFSDLVNDAINNFWTTWNYGFCLNGIAYNPNTGRSFN